ncbi:MAG: hypothetical protein JKY55_13980 [Aliivibrio sp.]|uniref:hypothetical protein n=1 Tax=Aliivibrio sp. TaxID=1872443 RepID=UPI001A4D089E|nr:hypothetical protein [Aliivibrio sp.]
MKKLLITTSFLFTVFFSPLSSAVDAKGTIKEIQICGTGQQSGNQWIRVLQFKIADKWFATWADNYGTTNSDLDNSISSSVLMMAYSQNLIVEVRATGGWHAYHEKCGVKSGEIFHGAAGDYIRLVK